MMLEHWEDCFRRGTLPPVLLLFGEERFLLEEAAELVRQRLEEQDPVGLNVEVVEAESLTGRELVERARVYPTLAPLRGIVVRQAERLLRQGSKEGAVLAEYLAKPEPTTVVVFLSEAAPESLRGISRWLRNPKQQKKAEQAIKQAPELWRRLLQEHAWVEFPKLYEREVASWVAQRARRYGYELTPPALEALLSTVGMELADLANELQKLAVVAQSQGLRTLEVDHVLQVAGLSRTYSVFELQKALAAADGEQVLQIAHYLVHSQRQELLIFSALTRYFLQLWKLADVAETPGATPEMVAGVLGVPSFFVADYQAAYRRFGPAGIERALFALQHAEAALKSGAAPAEAVVTELMVTLLSMVKRTG